VSATVESFGDKARAFALSVAVHAAFVLVAVFGLALSVPAKPVSVAGPIIEATLVTIAPPKPAVQRTQPKPVRPARPEPKPVEPEIAPPVPPRAEDTRDQEAVDRMAIQPSEAEREQEERRKREQLLLEEQERLANLERERQKQLEDIRRQREDAEKRRILEEAKLATLKQQETQRLAEQQRMQELLEQEQADAQPQGGNEGENDDLLGRYALAIQTAVTQNWLRPDHVQQVVCTLKITQIPGGEVISATVANPCNADDLTRRSLEAAVMRTQPLPYQGYESVFQRNVNFTFCYPRDLCRG
jgi:colicin import membrane protein